VRSSFGWVHFAIPTPVIVNDHRLRAVTALIRFITGPGAKITAFHVYDGEKKILNLNGLSLTSTNGPGMDRHDVTGHPEILWGTGISLGVQFSGHGPNDFIRLIAAGIDFN